MSEIVLRFPLAETEAALYQRVALETARMIRLGLSNLRIARVLGVDDKTVAKGLRWLGSFR